MRLGRSGLPLAWTLGARFVLDGHGRRRLAPEQLAIAAVALGSIGLVAVLTFGASRTELYAEPAHWGRTWDLALSPDDAASVAIPSEDVRSRAVVRIETLEIGGRPLEIRGFDAVTGPLALPVAAGRPPGAGEIALGAETMRSLSVGIGDEVTLSGPSGDLPVDVVGQAMLSGLTDVPVLASGGIVLEETLRQVSAPGESDGFSGEVLRFEDGADRRRHPPPAGGRLVGRRSGARRHRPTAVREPP